MISSIRRGRPRAMRPPQPAAAAGPAGAHGGARPARRRDAARGRRLLFWAVGGSQQWQSMAEPDGTASGSRLTAPPPRSGAMLAACSFPIWSFSTCAEVYTLTSGAGPARPPMARTDQAPGGSADAHLWVGQRACSARSTPRASGGGPRRRATACSRWRACSSGPPPAATTPPPPSRCPPSSPSAARTAAGEPGAALDQELRQLQPFVAVFPEDCVGQLPSCGPT